MDGERKEGKEYNYEGRLLYEGEYKKGKKHGKGKIYDNGWNKKELKYEGEFLNKRNMVKVMNLKNLVK